MTFDDARDQCRALAAGILTRHSGRVVPPADVSFVFISFCEADAVEVEVYTEDHDLAFIAYPDPREPGVFRVSNVKHVLAA